MTPAEARRTTTASSTASRPPGSIFMRLMTKIRFSGPLAYLGSFQVPSTCVLSEIPEQAATDRDARARARARCANRGRSRQSGCGLANGIAARFYRLAVLEPRLALFDKRAHALFLVRKRERRMKFAALEQQPFGERRFVRAIDRFLDLQHDRQRKRRDLRSRARKPPPRAWPPARRARPAPRARLRRRPPCGRSGTTPSPSPCRRRAAAAACRPCPGIVPIVISGWPNFALSAAMIVSQAIASSHPPPSAKPATAAITGLRMRRISSQSRVM